MEVNILLNKRVIDYRDHKVILEDGIEIATRTFIWVSGVTGVTIGNMNPSLIGRGGRIWGSMATVGRNRAVAEFSKVQMQGWLAWVMRLAFVLLCFRAVKACFLSEKSAAQ